MPVIAECTTSTREPCAARAFTTTAMFRQLVSEETLVPPNLRTTHDGEDARDTE